MATELGGEAEISVVVEEPSPRLMATENQGYIHARGERERGGESREQREA